MLVKMDKFDNCERIFSKYQFEGEYIKELAKQKKGPKPKKWEHNDIEILSVDRLID